MLVNYFCGVAGRLKALARESQVACKTGTKGPARQAPIISPAEPAAPLFPFPSF